MKARANILFTWEIGHGLGHILPFLPMAREFKALGHQVSFAVRDVRGAGAMLAREGFVVLQAPFHPDKYFPPDGPQPQSMADVLSIFGFTSPLHLTGMRAAWEGILQAIRPNLVIASYAPLSLLCARQLGIASMLLATPFELPIDRHPLPAWRQGAAAHGMDEHVIHTVNTVFDRVQVKSVREVFGADQTYLISFPELDFFAPRTQVQYCGAFFSNDVGDAPSWPPAQPNSGAKIFVYLRTELPQIQTILQAAHASPHRFCIVLRDADPALLDAWRAPNVTVTEHTLRLDQVLPECDAVLNYAGAGVTAASLLAGKPIVSCIHQFEAMLNAQQVMRLGAGLIVHPPTPQAISDALNQVTTQPKYVAAARQFASRYANYSPTQAAKNLAALALQRLG